jgi:hypothetical protein
MNDREDHALEVLDLYIRTRLDQAAAAHTSHADISARLKAILESCPDNQHDDAAAADS